MVFSGWPPAPRWAKASGPGWSRKGQALRGTTSPIMMRSPARPWDGLRRPPHLGAGEVGDRRPSPADEARPELTEHRPAPPARAAGGLGPSGPSHHRRARLAAAPLALLQAQTHLGRGLDHRPRGGKTPPTSRRPGSAIAVAVARSAAVVRVVVVEGRRRS